MLPPDNVNSCLHNYFINSYIDFKNSPEIHFFFKNSSHIHAPMEKLYSCNDHLSEVFWSSSSESICKHEKNKN
jgi:hypothetical protein